MPTVPKNDSAAAKRVVGSTEYIRWHHMDSRYALNRFGSRWKETWSEASVVSAKSSASATGRVKVWKITLSVYGFTDSDGYVYSKEKEQSPQLIALTPLPEVDGDDAPIGTPMLICGPTRAALARHQLLVQNNGPRTRYSSDQVRVGAPDYYSDAVPQAVVQQSDAHNEDVHSNTHSLTHSALAQPTITHHTPMTHVHTERLETTHAHTARVDNTHMHTARAGDIQAHTSRADGTDAHTEHDEDTTSDTAHAEDTPAHTTHTSQRYQPADLSSTLVPGDVSIVNLARTLSHLTLHPHNIAPDGIQLAVHNAAPASGSSAQTNQQDDTQPEIDLGLDLGLDNETPEQQHTHMHMEHLHAHTPHLTHQRNMPDSHLSLHQAPIIRPTSIDVHGVVWKWKSVDEDARPVERLDWKVIANNQTFRPRDGIARDALSYFYAMFPLGHLEEMCALTNATLTTSKDRRYAHHLTPGELLKWFGHWLNGGLLHYVSMDRKPESGCEIWTACCGKGHFLLKLELVQSADASEREHEADHQHGTATTLRLVQKYFGSGRAIYAKMFPMKVLGREELAGEGHWSSMVTTDSANNQYIALVWSDRNRKYFISTQSTTKPGTTISRMRVRNDGNTIAAKEVRCQQPQLVEQYFIYNDIVDRHNRHRQDTLNHEKKLEVRTWHKRVATSLLAMCIVNALLLYNGTRTPTEKQVDQRNYYMMLSKELMNNNYEARVIRSVTAAITIRPEVTTSGVGAHATPIKEMKRERRKNKYGEVVEGLRAYRKYCKYSGYLKKKCRTGDECSMCGLCVHKACFMAHLRESHPHDED
ncbi:hypothetical protein SARC_02111 [Sphaeroforma arctica JP610]|uniref:PiggyBac transposable element-derived protein domain-containing protein n=1 Tax=Sphaeroforma arctica JP610 TaxID=667725 RepID=A0A0L0G9M1_9EUKA|nr:hypothetical protein SARC_02111 [Sphaeroforma arctica JP610]KNC85700.1 hypothetical protein SARC_02111 [Sphaeroforma arctica JP610]|eukprot:XP_014159602.1 hypothetical protein SARC_02111 [Sphaeroforma arctica JP610]